MADLFSRLFRYRPTGGRLPWEDWFTELLGAVLDRYPKLGAGYAAYLIGRDVETADIETQRTFDNARPDMWVDAYDANGDRHVVMVEHKMGAPAEAPQLQAYELRLQKQTADTRTLVHIAGSSAPPDFDVTSDGVKYKCFKWFQIYRWLARWTESAESGGESVEFADELLKFMEKWGMTIEISMNELVAATAYRTNQVEQRLKQILDSAWVGARGCAAGVVSGEVASAAPAGGVETKPPAGPEPPPAASTPGRSRRRWRAGPKGGRHRMSLGPVRASGSRGCPRCLAWAIPRAVRPRVRRFAARVGTREEAGSRRRAGMAPAGRTRSPG